MVVNFSQFTCGNGFIVFQVIFCTHAAHNQCYTCPCSQQQEKCNYKCSVIIPFDLLSQEPRPQVNVNRFVQHISAQQEQQITAEHIKHVYAGIHTFNIINSPLS